MRAAEIHARIGRGWPAVLEQLGIPEAALRKRHGPCPACGGKDRYRFDNKRGRGDFICNNCGAGDGFRLLQQVHGWTFAEARQRVLEAAHLEGAANGAPVPQITPPKQRFDAEPSRPTARVIQLLRGACAVSNCRDARDYLESRGLWPLPVHCTLKAHPCADYFEDGRRVGRYPALLAEIRDVDDSTVSVHITYLENGAKLATHNPRKILSPLTGHTGCAAQLMTTTETLGIAEGVETALSAAILDDLPVWAALNTALLAKFEPPPGVARLRVYADRDEAGLTAALRLAERLQGRVHLEVRIPTAPAKDWNDALQRRQGERISE